MASFPWDDDFGGDDWKDLASQMIDPSTISQSQTAIDQRHQAKELEKNNIRPIYTTPASETEALRLARLASENDISRLPGQAGIEGRLDQTTANQISMLERMSMGGPDLINAASIAYGNQQQAENQLGVEAARYSADVNRFNDQNYQRQLGIDADYQDKAWDWNFRMPYDQRYALMQALKGASQQNSNESWNTSVGGAKDFFSSFFSYGMAGSDSSNKGGGATADQRNRNNGYGDFNSPSSGSSDSIMDRYNQPMIV